MYECTCFRNYFPQLFRKHVGTEIILDEPLKLYNITIPHHGNALDYILNNHPEVRVKSCRRHKDIYRKGNIELLKHSQFAFQTEQFNNKRCLMYIFHDSFKPWIEPGVARTIFSYLCMSKNAWIQQARYKCIHLNKIRSSVLSILSARAQRTLLEGSALDSIPTQCMA